MANITAEILDEIPFSRLASAAVIQRGTKYFREDRVYEIEFNGSAAYCLVEGSYEEDYEVNISLQSGQLRTSCTCPHARQVQVCKHIIASVLALSDLIKMTGGTPQNAWESKLSKTLENLPKNKKTRKPKPYVAVFLLHRNEYHYGVEFTLSGRIIKDKDWLSIYAGEKEPAEINKTLKATKYWERHIERTYSPVKPEGCLNLTPEGVTLLNIIMQQGSYYSGMENFASYLPHLAMIDAPIFLVDSYRELEGKVEILPDPVEIKAALIQNKNGYMLQAGVELDDKIYTSAKENLDVVSDDPAWALLGEKLVSVTNPESLPMLSAFPLQIPLEEEEYFRKNYLSQIAEHLPFEGDLINWSPSFALATEFTKRTRKRTLIPSKWKICPTPGH